MNEKVKEILKVVFGGIGGVILTLLCQYLLPAQQAPQPQSITVIINGQEYNITEDDYRTTLDANEQLHALNEKLRDEIATLQDKNTKLQQEVDELQQVNSTMNNSAGSNSTGSSSTGSNGTGSNSTGSNGTGSNSTGSNGTGSSSTGSNGTGSNGTGSNGTGSNSTGNNGTGNNGVGDNEAVSGINNIKGTVRLRNNENIIGCPQVNIPAESQISGQTKYTMTWNPFENATTYRISMWKDANYGTADSDIIFIDEVEVSELSYIIDLTTLEPGYTYGYNVVVDNHFSSPLLIELY